jgi:hypothetical protein
MGVLSTGNQACQIKWHIDSLTVIVGYLHDKHMMVGLKKLP